MADEDLKSWPVIITIIILCVSAVVAAYFVHAIWAIISIVVAAFIISAIAIISLINSRRDLILFSKLAEGKRPEELSAAQQLLAEIWDRSAEKKPFSFLAGEVFGNHFQLARFVIFFRENDKYIARLYHGVPKNNLATVGTNRLVTLLKGDIKTGVTTNEIGICRLAFKADEYNELEAGIAFAYSWGKNKSVFLVADDKSEALSQALNDEKFNRVFWPGLEYNLRMNVKLAERNIESRKTSGELAQAQRDILNLARELKNKLLDVQAFVKISNELYSIFNEDELLAALKNIVKKQLNAERAEVLVPSGDGKYILRASDDLDNPKNEKFILDSESELARLLARSPKPILLPLVGPGLQQNEPFLNDAMRAGLQVMSGIRIGGQIACILIVGPKNDGAHFENLDIDILYVISNIASLSLDNIHQYTTIEKLSYTDSLTEVYNYRYFHKRLGEEILRAKRYSRELSLVILDIDNFKSFNDNYGHQAGDIVLRQLSDLVTKTIRSIDVVSRYGGEEFCIIMPDTGAANCETFIERLRCQIAEFNFESGLFPTKTSISVSVGGAVYPYHALTPERLIYCADMALLKAKSQGRNRSVMYQAGPDENADSAKGIKNGSQRESIP